MAWSIVLCIYVTLFRFMELRQCQLPLLVQLHPHDVRLGQILVSIHTFIKHAFLMLLLLDIP